MIKIQDTDLIIDGLVLSMLITATLAASYNSYLLGIIPGILLAFITVAGHNYIHRKDTFRIYYFELSGSSCRYIIFYLLCVLIYIFNTKFLTS